MTEEQTIKELKRNLLKVKIERDALQTELDRRIVLEAQMCKKTMDILHKLGLSYEEILRVYGTD